MITIGVKVARLILVQAVWVRILDRKYFLEYIHHDSHVAVILCFLYDSVNYYVGYSLYMYIAFLSMLSIVSAMEKSDPTKVQMSEGKVDQDKIVELIQSCSPDDVVPESYGSCDENPYKILRFGKVGYCIDTCGQDIPLTDIAFDILEGRYFGLLSERNEVLLSGMSNADKQEKFKNSNSELRKLKDGITKGEEIMIAEREARYKSKIAKYEDRIRELENEINKKNN